MKPISNLDAILQDDYSFQYYLGRYQGLQNVTISTHQIGELVLTSGRIIPCDPMIVPDVRYHLKKTVKPGCYPVIISLANFQPSGDARIACAKLQFTNAPTIKWDIAYINEPAADRTEDQMTYGVDAGTGCFIDWDAAEIIADLVSLDVRYPEKDEFEFFCDRVFAEMDKNAFGKYKVAGWANMKVSDKTEANIIAFSSGWGDGGYASFWGYDADGNLTSLVTDFALFPKNEDAS